MEMRKLSVFIDSALSRRVLP